MNPETIEDAVWAMIAQMAWVRREYGPHSRPRGLREFEPFEWCHDRHDVRHTDALEEAVEDAWPRYRYPRPALVLSLRQSALIRRSKSAQFHRGFGSRDRSRGS